MKRIKKEHKEKIMNEIRKAGDPINYETSWNEEGSFVSKKKSEIKKGKLSRSQGARFELKVREEMESRGWILTKWMNNIDLEKEKIISAKRKYNPFKKAMVIGTGFPDFLAFRRYGKKCEVIGVEVKSNGILSREEKEKCKWLIEKNIFLEILIAKKGEKRGKIEYINFREKY
jgi:hypothetical protein